MIDDELVRIWQSSPNQERIKFEKSRLIIEVQSNLDRVQNVMRVRDLMDRSGVVIVMPVFAVFAFVTPFILTKIACVLTVLWGIYAIFRLRKARRNKPKTLEGSYLEYLKKCRLHLMDEKDLLDNVLYWALIPFLVTGFMFFFGFLEGPHAKLTNIIIICTVGVIASGVVYYLNKLVVRTMLNPRLEKVNKLIEVLEQE